MWWWDSNSLRGKPGLPALACNIARKAARESWPYRRRKGRGGGREYPLSCLPLETQLAIVERSTSEELKELMSESNAGKFGSLEPKVQSTITQAVVGPDDIPTLSASLTTGPLKLSPQDLKNPKKACKFKVAQVLSTLPSRAGREKTAQDFARLYNVHRATIWRWAKWAKEQASPSSAVQVERQEEPEFPRSKVFSPQAVAFGLAVYARNIQCGRRAAYRALEQKAQQTGWRMGDYTSFTRLIRRVPDAVWAKIERGNLGFELHYVPKIIRDWLAVPVQSIICGDQKIFDYEIYDPESDQIIITNGYIWMDCASRAINGIWIELGPYNSFTVGHSLREALRFGIPEDIFTDWGKPEGSAHITHIRNSIQNLCNTGDYSAFQNKYYLNHKKARVQTPWQKPIENIMNQMDLLLKEHFPPGYRKRSTEAWANNEIQKKLRSDRKSGKLLTVSEFLDLVFTTVDTYNHRSKKLKEGKTIIPAKVFKEGLGLQNRIRLSNEALNYVCLPTYRRKPHQGKVGVQLRANDYREYFSFKISGLDSVSVSIDPYDKEAPAVLTDPGGNFVDLAEPIPHVVPGETSKKGAKFLEARARYMKEIRRKAKEIKDAFGLVDKKEVIAIGAVTRVANQAKKAKEGLDQVREEQKKQAKVIKMEAHRDRERLKEEMALEQKDEAPDSRIFKIPEDPRGRFRLWKTLDSKQNRSIEEQRFWEYFKNTADYRAYKALEDDFGDFWQGKGGNNTHDEVLEM